MKHGLTYEDHHFRDKEGKYQGSPPRELTKLYDQGPPKKVSMTAEINSLKAQTQCCGVYTLLPESKTSKGGEGGATMWKHSTEDLVLTSTKISGEDGWVVTRFTTAGVRQQICMKALTNPGEFPFKNTTWQEWDGRGWIPAPSVKCRPSWHGWGLDKLDRGRLKFNSSMPEGAF